MRLERRDSALDRVVLVSAVLEIDLLRGIESTGLSPLGVRSAILALWDVWTHG
jgi:hypothetical protein